MRKIVIISMLIMAIGTLLPNVLAVNADNNVKIEIVDVFYAELDNNGLRNHIIYVPPGGGGGGGDPSCPLPWWDWIIG